MSILQTSYNITRYSVCEKWADEHRFFDKAVKRTVTFPPPPTLLTRTIHYFALLHCIHLAPTWSRLGSQLLLMCVRVGVRASGERAHFHHHYVNGTFGMEPGDMLNDDDCGPNLVGCSCV